MVPWLVTHILSTDRLMCHVCKTWKHPETPASTHRRKCCNKILLLQYILMVPCARGLLVPGTGCLVSAPVNDIHSTAVAYKNITSVQIAASSNPRSDVCIHDDTDASPALPSSVLHSRLGCLLCLPRSQHDLRHLQRHYGVGPRSLARGAIRSASSWKPSLQSSCARHKRRTGCQECYVLRKCLPPIAFIFSRRADVRGLFVLERGWRSKHCT